MLLSSMTPTVTSRMRDRWKICNEPGKHNRTGFVVSPNFRDQKGQTNYYHHHRCFGASNYREASKVSQCFKQANLVMLSSLHRKRCA